VSILWYEQPARDWQREALPIGNGALGAMVFGGVGTERLQLNEKTLWTGGPGSAGGYGYGGWPQPRPGAVAAVRDRIGAAGALPAAEVVAALGTPRRGYGAYQPLGDLFLDLVPAPGEAGTVTGYRRELDLADGVARVGFTLAGVRHTRSYFASYPGNVIVARLTADRPGAVSVTLRLVPAPAGAVVTVAADRLTGRGALADNRLRYEVQLQVRTRGGSVAAGPDRLTVTGADQAVLVLSAGTDYADAYPDYRREDPGARVTATVDAAVAVPYRELRERHLADHRGLAGRVRLDLGQPERTALPTDRLRAGYPSGDPAADRALEALHFGYGRYLLIASSRAGSLPANLQGVWNDSPEPAWHGDYHLNINLQMCYWPAEVTHLAETAAPLHRFVEALRAPGRVAAREMFGTGGWVVHSETNPFGFTGVQDWPSSFWFPEAAAWLARHLAEHYRFTGDAEFLRRRAWPVLREAAEFWLANLHPAGPGRTLLVSPSGSPEHGPYTAGAAISQQLVRDLLAGTEQAARLVGADPALRHRLRSALDRLDPGLRVGSWGQLQEWRADRDDPAGTHRHLSHLFALYPGDQLCPLAEPELAAAAAVSLQARSAGARSAGGGETGGGETGGGETGGREAGGGEAGSGEPEPGWSRAWKVALWARLRDGDRAHRALAGLLRHRTLPNLWADHPPYQLDGNLGATAGVAELLLQSHRGVVDLLPALPAAWPAGSVTGLRARGGLSVDLWWRDRAVTGVRLAADRAGPVTVRCARLAGRPVVELATGRPVPVTRVGAASWRFTARAGGRYRVAIE